MSEMPERKVLKEILSKLKAKTISSWSSLVRSIQDKDEIFSKAVETMKEIKEVRKDEISQRQYQIIDILHRCYSDVVVDAVRHIGELNLYIESIESYSTELDKTLWDAIDQARKKAEEEIKQQEKLAKRKSPESYRV